jgi:hypothetical protein
VENDTQQVATGLVTGKTCRWELCGSIFVAVHSHAAPLDAEYDDGLRGYETHLGRFRGILIFTRGGAPNARQRKRTTDFWVGRDLPKTVIMTSSTVARGVVTALNWFMAQKLKAIDSDDFAGAFDYLEVAPDERPAVQATVLRLDAQLRTPAATARD